jgi:hypothetical protein
VFYQTGDIDITLDDEDIPGVKKFLIYFRNMDQFVEFLSKNPKFWNALKDNMEGYNNE